MSASDEAPRESAGRKPDWSTWGAVLLGVGYGAFARLVFGLDWPRLNQFFEAVSVMFLFVVPFGLGVLTIRFAARFGSSSWLTWVWTDAIMRDLQNGICRVIQRRSEREARGQL